VSAHVLVPVKRLDRAKSRLAGALAPGERVAIVQEMLAAVLTAIDEAGVGPVTLVSSEPLAANGIPRFDDGGLPWNDALTAAMSGVQEDLAAVVSADLPRLSAEDLRSLVASVPEWGVAIARAKDGGTNAVAMRPPGVLGTRFGEPGSAAVHERAACEAGLEAVVIDLPGLAFDVDTLEDLAAWRS
jgi:2-phospho-L-lactate guanylyltransferase